ncbi:Uncharacterised protein [Mycobacteroides abscessus subsp. abscessus]|nr:Uncharacterised protein [Mycobacteroides abscessus subsp. abscessus]
MMARRMAESFSDIGTPSTKDLSILMVEIGILFKYEREDTPVPKSSKATESPISLNCATA